MLFNDRIIVIKIIATTTTPAAAAVYKENVCIFNSIQFNLVFSIGVKKKNLISYVYFI